MVYIQILLVERVQDQEFVRRLKADLPTIVARALTAEGRLVRPGDIVIDGRIQRHENGPRLNPPMATRDDTTIVIWAERTPLLEAYASVLAQRIHTDVFVFVPPGTSLEVQIFLPVGGSNREPA